MSSEPAVFRHKLTLRFRCRRTESHFVSSQSEELVRNFFWLAVLLGVANASLLVLLLPIPEGAPGAADCRLLAVAANAVSLLVAVVAGVVTGVGRLSASMSAQSKEIAAVMVMTLLSSLIFLADAWYGPALLGYDPQQVWGPDVAFSDTRAVLALSGVVAASHLTLPIRCVLLVPLEAFTVAAYAACAFALGGPAGPEARGTLALYLGSFLSEGGAMSVAGHGGLPRGACCQPAPPLAQACQGG